MSPMPLSVQDLTALHHADQNAIVVADEKMQNGVHALAESIVCASKRLQDDLQMMGRRIKEHEDTLRSLKAQKIILEDSILDKQAFLGKHHSSSLPTPEDQNLSHSQNEEEITKQILRHEQSAAGLFCQLKTRFNNTHAFKNVVGIVATLGKVADDNLSRLLAEYLGMDTMLAIVCRTYEGVKALETYDSEGCINRSVGLHGLGASIGRQLTGRFQVICLENLRQYAGDFFEDDPQRRLDLLKPRLPDGQTPPGFVGFAVNMIELDSANLFYVTPTFCGLRETLFYNLFSHLQVYQTRTDMLNALPCINDGAISLDGGIIRPNGVFSLGSREDVSVRFGVGLTISNVPMDYFEIENQIKMMKWRKEKLMEDIKREQAFLDEAKFTFEVKKQEFVKFLAESSSFMNQQQMPPS